MLICWYCEQRFDAAHVRADGSLHGRAARAGGPYLLYRCPSCARRSKVETTRAERLFASPERELSAADLLFAWLEVLAPGDFLQLLRWQRDFTGIRRTYFERDGDARYSRSPWRSAGQRVIHAVTAPLRWLLGRVGDWTSPRGPRPSRPRRPSRAGASSAGGEGHGAADSSGRASRRRSDRRERGDGSEARGIPHSYRVLGLSPGASPREVRLAFRRLVRRHHPDKLASRDPAAVAEASRRFDELLRAYEELGGEARRRG